MSKEDYEAIAAVLKNTRNQFCYDETADEVINYIAARLCFEFLLDNERFDERRFLAATKEQKCIN